MMSSRMAGILCIRCAGAQEALAQARAQIDKLEAELAAARHQVHEVTKAKDLMQLDLDRLVAQIIGGGVELIHFGRGLRATGVVACCCPAGSGAAV
jgi:hypothetical protein